MAERSLQPFYPELLSRIGTETRLGAGAMLWHEGDPGDSVVLLLDGTLEVLLEAGDESEEVILRTLGAGRIRGQTWTDLVCFLIRYSLFASVGT